LEKSESWYPLLLFGQKDADNQEAIVLGSIIFHPQKLLAKHAEKSFTLRRILVTSSSARKVAEQSRLLVKPLKIAKVIGDSMRW